MTGQTKTVGRDEAKHDLKFPEGPYPARYEINLSQDFLDKTLRKVQEYRPTSGLSAEWTIEGPAPQHVEQLAQYWGSVYDWKSVEEKISTDYQHYATVIPEVDNYTHPIPLHFIHHRSKNEDAMPLLLLHGWPSSFLEWSRVIGSLTNHPTQSFHIVAPSLPGFGFSPAPTAPGLGPRQMGNAFNLLMKQLGYDRYSMATTDLGWTIGMWMAHEQSEHIIGHFCDFFFSPPNDDDLARMQSGTLTAEEAAYLGNANAWMNSHSAYSTVHSQKPLALSYAFTDSPVGFLAWIWDLAYTASDGYECSEEELITDTMMLWIPGPYANIRTYLEYYKPGNMQFPTSTVPTGVSQWGFGQGPFQDIGNFPFVPQEWIKRTVNLTYFNRHTSGGHFPSIKEPGLWVQDVQAFFYQLNVTRAQ
ncbi:Alpha/Beta hydrolase protein [Stachybotrys elegans]|uniref:Alpha/Beta hydrolase protein n=1 Tax=Stachybotrys elegans TaxID=80388 RepID=A0A8K0WQ78_9HYPO|nr:Alpha/Beta hydrolase protein [Stachybotrys elegans]